MEASRGLVVGKQKMVMRNSPGTAAALSPPCVSRTTGVQGDHLQIFNFLLEGAWLAMSPLLISEWQMKGSSCGYPIFLLLISSMMPTLSIFCMSRVFEQVGGKADTDQKIELIIYACLSGEHSSPVDTFFVDH